MNSIKDMVMNEIVIEKSRFITYLFPVEDAIKAKEIITELNKKYQDATHVVYAFITENDVRSNDNGEPKGTAGMPTLEVLRKENMINVLAVTIRYFGGIKLGAGGLVRAYTKGVSDAMKNAVITHEEEITEISITTTYKDSFYLDKNLSLSRNTLKTFDDKVTYNITLLKKDLISFLLLILLLVTLSSCTTLKEYKKLSIYFSTEMEITIYSNNNIDAENALKYGFDLFEKYNNLTDRYNEYSGVKGIYYINHHPNEEIEIDLDLFKLLEYSIEKSKLIVDDLNNPYFTVGIGKLSDIYHPML